MKKDKIIAVSVSSDEKRKIESLARQTGEKPGQILRRLGLAEYFKQFPSMYTKSPPVG